MQAWKAAPPTAGFTRDIEMPTLLRPGECTCSWVVSEQGAGMACISKLKVFNRSCPVRHRPLAAVPATFPGSE